MEKVRLDKAIASQGTQTRSQVRKMLKNGLVTVNGVPEKDAGRHVCAGEDVICINGVALNYRRFIYIMMNKPAGVVSASRDPKTQTVVDLVPESLKRDGLFPAGRLDKDTTGFMLITDDGDYAHRMLSPKNHVSKIYVAALDAPVCEKEIQEFEKGIVLSDGTKCLRALLEPLNDGAEACARVTVCEGKFHQVKRMFQAVGREVTALKRVQIGGVKLDESLKPGECRQLTQNEELSIFNK